MRKVQILSVGALWLAFAAIFTWRIDPDFGWHLQAGRYIWMNGVPAHDVFSYTGVSFPWVDHEWLSDVLTAGLMWLGGFGLVAAWFAAVWTAALVVAARRPHWPVLAAGFAAVAADAVARPNAWSALGLALVMLGCERGWRWRLVVVFVVWANLHGGFAVGFLALAVAAVRQPKYWWVLAVSVAATFINPYGWNVYVEIWRTLGDSNLSGRVGEWAPLKIGVLTGFYVVLVIFAMMTRGVRRWEHVLPAGLFAAAVISMRHFILFVVGSLGVVTRGYERLVDLLRARSGWRAAVLMLVATGLVVAPVIKIMRHPGNDFPVAQVANLRERPCVGRVFNDFDFGGYMLWQLPGVLDYIDGRMPSWSDAGGSYFERWRGVLDDEAYARSEFARYGIGCALVYPSRARLIGQLRAEGWRVSSQDGTAVLLRRP